MHKNSSVVYRRLLWTLSLFWVKVDKQCPEYISCRVATCWVLLAQMWPFSNLSQKHPTCRNTSQHIATRWPNARNMLRPTMLPYVAWASFGWGFKAVEIRTLDFTIFFSQRKFCFVLTLWIYLPRVFVRISMDKFFLKILSPNIYSL